MRKLKQSRAASYVAVALVYIIAAVVGVVTYNAIELPRWLATTAVLSESDGNGGAVYIIKLQTCYVRGRWVLVLAAKKRKGLPRG